MIVFWLFVFLKNCPGLLANISTSIALLTLISATVRRIYNFHFDLLKKHDSLNIDVMNMKISKSNLQIQILRSSLIIGSVRMPNPIPKPTKTPKMIVIMNRLSQRHFIIPVLCGFSSSSTRVGVWDSRSDLLIMLTFDTVCKMVGCRSLSTIYPLLYVTDRHPFCQLLQRWICMPA